MGIVTADLESRIIWYLSSGDPRGAKLLRKYYAAPLYGMIKRMNSSPILSTTILESTFEEVIKNIEQHTAHPIRFFTWMMQIARRLTKDAGLELFQKNQETNEDTVLGLVMDRGFTLTQTASVLGISKDQVAAYLHKDLKARRKN